MKPVHPLVIGAAALILATGCSAPGTVTSTAVPAASTAAPAPASPASGQEVDKNQLLEDLAAASNRATTYAMEMTLKGTAAGQDVSGTINALVDQTDKANPRMKYSMDLGGMAMEMIMVDGNSYVKMALLGDTWMKMTAEQMAQAGVDTPGVGASSGLEAARDSIQKVVFLGEEEVGGHATRHYRATVDAAAFDQMGGSGLEIEGETFDYDLWVDADNLMRRFSMTGQAEGSPLQMTATFDKWGEPVSIEAPDPSTVTDMPS